MSLRTHACWILTVIALSGCVHHRAIKVDCDGGPSPNKPTRATGPCRDASREVSRAESGFLRAAERGSGRG